MKDDSPKLDTQETSQTSISNKTPFRVVENHKSNKNLKFTVMVMGIMIVVLGIISVYLYFNKSQKLTITTTPTSTQNSVPENQSEGIAEDSTSRWKVYENSKFGFSFKYPDGWVEDNTVVVSKEVVRFTSTKNRTFSVALFAGGTGIGLGCEDLISQDELSLNDWVGTKTETKGVTNENCNNVGNSSISVGIVKKEVHVLIMYGFKTIDSGVSRTEFNSIIETFKFDLSSNGVKLKLPI